MKIKNRHLAVALVLAGMAVSGCTQQQAAAVVPAVEAAPEPAPVTEYVPQPQPVIQPAPVMEEEVVPVQAPRGQSNDRWAHTHPSIPGCTDSITHNHPFNNANHTHRYSCRGQRQQQVRRPVQHQQRPRPHQYQQQQQHHQQQRPVYRPKPIMVPKVKAKGNYRGPIQIDGNVRQQYQQ